MFALCEDPLEGKIKALNYAWGVSEFPSSIGKAILLTPICPHNTEDDPRHYFTSKDRKGPDYLPMHIVSK